MLPGESYFNAVLKDENDEYLGDGYASVSVRNKSVDFRSQFVPLLRFGTKAKILRVVDGQEVHSFEGTVYLSSPSLMRLVDVKDILLAHIELEMPHSISIRAHVSPMLSKNGMLQFAAQKLLKSNAEVFAISLTKLRFTCPEKFYEDEQLYVNMFDPLPLKNVQVEVIQTLQFGDKHTGYRCNILSMQTEDRALLTEFLSERAQVFPVNTNDLFEGRGQMQ